MRSSASRERWIASIESVNSSSATKSRSLTASMLLGESCAKPRLPWRSTRETGNAQPATAPEPSGSTAAARPAAARRARSRSSGQKCESIQCAAETGCARCMCVYAGMSTFAGASDSACASITLLQLAHGAVEHAARVHRPEARGGRDLIVAAATRVQLGGDVADLFVQQAIDEGVHVFVGGDGLLAGAKTIGDGVEPVLERETFFDGDDAGAPERDRPCFGEPDVEGPETEVDADGAVEGIRARARCRRRSGRPRACARMRPRA